MPKVTQNRDVKAHREFGQRLRELRHSLKYTQAEIAYALGIQVARYNKYEIGRSAAPYQLLIRLAKQFGADIHYLVCGEIREEYSDDNKFSVALTKTIEVLPTPAVLYDGQGKLVSNNDLYVQTFFRENPGIVKPGTPHEFLMRTWAYSSGMNTKDAEAFVEARLAKKSTKYRSFHIVTGHNSYFIAERIHKDYKIVIVTEFAAESSIELG